MKTKSMSPGVYAALAVAAMTAALLWVSRTEGSYSASDPIILRAGHPASADEPYHKGLEEFARLVEARTGGKIQVEIFPSGQLGNERMMIEGLLLGTLDIVVTANGSATNFVPQLGVMDLPFLFRDREHMYRVLDGEIGEDLQKASGSRGLRILGFYDAGIRHVMTNEKPIRDIDDLRGSKIRTMPVPAHLASFNAFGAQAVAIDYGELYGALQTELIDGAEAANTNYRRQRFYEVAPYWAQIGWINLVADLMISEERFLTLPAETQAALLDAGKQSALHERDLYARSDDSLLAELKRLGVEITYPDPKPFRKAAERVYDEYLTSDDGRRLLARIRSE